MADLDSPGTEDARVALVRRVDRRLFWAGGLTNGLGAAGVVAFLTFLAPTTLTEAELDQAAGRLPVFAIYMAVALPAGWYLIQRRPFHPIETWVRSGEPPSDAIQIAILRYPRDWAVKSAVPWLVGAVITAVTVAFTDVSVAIAAGLGVVAGGLSACSLEYLVVERILRPITALALAGSEPPEINPAGVGTRAAMAWLLGSGVPLLGMVGIGLADLTGASFGAEDLVGATLSLAIIGLAIGSAATLIAARSVVDPLASMRHALERVELGELDARVDVDDGSEVGLLEAGFNRMTQGLAERERLRDAFGAFVDPSLAERVLEEGTDFAGEELELSLLFMDVRGFTTFSEGIGPHQVVASLNELYERVVPIVLEHGGHANKFIGDGLLAVFGAPAKLADHADRAVAAALDIGSLNHSRHISGLQVGVGVNSGEVVVGTIGGGGRLDFTVIGDPVNTAARVESATRQTGDDVLITEATKSLLTRDHGEWVERDPEPLKGKSEPVRLFAPAG